MIQLNREAGISKKYDGTLDYGIEMYDNLPYQRNSDVCNGSTVALYSGHIIKYYLCNNEEEAYPINNRDDEIQSILRHACEEAEKRQTEDTEPEVIGDPSEITDEQIQALTTDQSSDNDGTEAEPAGTPEVVNLDDIEDW
ncbi:unknown [Clostridium sp. CAG:277]|jgi:hypothetical protein|uniref:hypothetical protein n=1 Tax=Jutongia sp. TaxID=2944204 RepID=UPI000337DA89|nr:hypothetical protein [Clostridium sp.]CDE69143.1 unknown [Clostridium sp. CAG:277]